MAGGIFSLQCIIDVQRYAIGGGISRQPLLMKVMNEELDHVFQGKGKRPVTKPELVACTFANEANMIGSLYHFLSKGE